MNSNKHTITIPKRRELEFKPQNCLYDGVTEDVDDKTKVDILLHVHFFHHRYAFFKFIVTIEECKFIMYVHSKIIKQKICLQRKGKRVTA